MKIPSLILALAVLTATATSLSAARLTAERIAAVIACTAFEAGPERQPFVAEFDLGVAEVIPGESAAKALEIAAMQASERQAS